MSSAGTDIDMSSDHARSVRSVKSAMSIDDDGPTTPPRKEYVVHSFPNRYPCWLTCIHSSATTVPKTPRGGSV
jgi:hypothetical protein